MVDDSHENNDFVVTNLFCFNNEPCVCRVEEINTHPNEAAEQKIKVGKKANTKPIRFEFVQGKGLVRYNLYSAIEENVLGAFVSLDGSSLNSFQKFFQKNGYLYSGLSETEYTDVDVKKLIKDYKLLKNIVELNSEVTNGKEKNWGRIVCLFLNILKAHSEMENTCLHSYFDCLFNAQNGMHVQEDTTNVDESVSWDIAADYVYKRVHSVSAVGYLDLVEMRNPDRCSKSKIYINSAIVYVEGRNDSIPGFNAVADTIYHFQKNIAPISTFDEDNVQYETEPDWQKLDSSLKEALLGIGKIAIAATVNSYISGICPLFDIGTLKPRWTIDCLLTAMYFSLFYMRPEYEKLEI